jgi:hypothetical protein
LVVIGGLYTINRMWVANRWLERFWEYVQERDAVWGPFIGGVEEHLKRQDGDAETSRKTQAEMLREQAIILKNQAEILRRLDAGQRP